MFQVVPPCGGHRAFQRSIARELSGFQVVPPCGGHRRGLGRWFRIRCSFKSCPRVGGILFGKDSKGNGEKVSSRAPVWGASGEC